MIGRALLGALVVVLIGADARAQSRDFGTYEAKEIYDAAAGFFGGASEGLAKVVERAFQDLGKPNGFIAGEEAGGAFVAGLRYGRGELNRKNGSKTTVYWQGPTIGFDFGGEAAKVFTLVYGLDSPDTLFQRFPAIDGSLYFVAGAAVNYQRSGAVTLAPIRTGVGLRAGANVGYVHYGRQHSWIPF